MYPRYILMVTRPFAHPVAYRCVSLGVVAQSLKRVKRLYSYANNVGSCYIRLHDELVTCNL